MFTRTELPPECLQADSPAVVELDQYLDWKIGPRRRPTSYFAELWSIEHIHPVHEQLRNSGRRCPKDMEHQHRPGRKPSASDRVIEYGPPPSDPRAQGGPVRVRLVMILWILNMVKGSQDSQNGIKRIIFECTRSRRVFRYPCQYIGRFLI